VNVLYISIERKQLTQQQWKCSLFVRVHGFFGVQIWSVHVVFMARSVSQFFIETHEQENTSYGRGKRHQQVISVLFDSQKVGIRGTS